MSYLVSTACAVDAYPVTPSDGADLPKTARALKVTGTAGDVRLVTVDGSERTVPSALFDTFAIGARKVFATGTTATGIYALA